MGRASARVAFAQTNAYDRDLFASATLRAWLRVHRTARARARNAQDIVGPTAPPALASRLRQMRHSKERCHSHIARAESNAAISLGSTRSSVGAAHPAVVAETLDLVKNANVSYRHACDSKSERRPINLAGKWLPPGLA